MDCGPACLRMVTKFYGKVFSMKYLRDKCYASRTGVSVLGLSEAAEGLGFRTIASALTLKQLAELDQFPCIAHWNENHFIVIYDIQRRKVKSLSFSRLKETTIFVADPKFGKIKFSEKEFLKGWISKREEGMEKGVCLFLEPTPNFYNDANDYTDRNSFFNLLSYLKPYKSLIVQLLLGFLITSLFSLFTPFLTQSIVDKGVNYKDLSFLTIILAAQLSLTIGNASVGFIRGWIMLHLTNRVSISLISDFLRTLMRLPIAFFDSRMVGDVIQRINDNQRIQSFLTSTLVTIVFSLGNFVVFSVIIASYSVKVFSIFLLGSSLYIIWIKLFMKYRKELDFRRFTLQSQNQSGLIQMITGMQEIKLNNCEKQRRWEWERIQIKGFKVSMKGLMVGQYQTAGAILINGSKNFIITYVVAQSVIRGEMTLGMMLAVQYIIGQLNGPIESLISFAQGYQDAKMSMERLNEIEEYEPEVNDSLIMSKDIDKNADLVLNDVSFQYEGPHSAHVLKNVTLVIPSKKVTAIVGTSGSGKTTLLKLLLGFYRPTKGDVRLGAQSLYSIHPSRWRKSVGAVMQDGFIFSNTIAENIAISDEQIDTKKLDYSVDMSNIREFIESLPLGFNTRIGAEGGGVSQGQKQRILIARAIYKNPDFLLFDEATNALDANNESLIMSNLEDIFTGKTVVVVAHRLSTVKNADKIVVLEKGEIVEIGTHAELTGRKGAYYKLVKNQLELSA